MNLDEQIKAEGDIRIDLHVEKEEMILFILVTFISMVLGSERD